MYASQLFGGAIHRINRYPVDKCWQIKTNRAIRWIVIYPMDNVIHNVIHLSNNPGQVIKARRQINMGYWPSLFGRDGWILVSFFFARLWNRDWVKYFIDKLDQKRTYYVEKEHCLFFWPQQVANQNAGFGWSSCPARGLFHIVKPVIGSTNDEKREKRWHSWDCWGFSKPD